MCYHCGAFLPHQIDEGPTQGHPHITGHQEEVGHDPGQGQQGQSHTDIQGQDQTLKRNTPEGSFFLPIFFILDRTYSVLISDFMPTKNLC